MFKIGVITDCFKTDVKSAVLKAKNCGASGIQVYGTYGDISPEMTPAQRREFLSYVKDNGLVISAVCGDFGGHGFMKQEDNAAKIEQSKRILELARDLETNIVTTHIGVIPEDASAERYKVMQEACHTLASEAEKMNAHFAVETGPERAVVLKGFLDGLNSKGVAVNLDPANLVMVTGDDPAQAVHTLKDYIVHTHAKDGRRLMNVGPEKVYIDVEQEIQDAAYFIELPLGQGDVDFASYTQALRDIGYNGFLTIERETGGQPETDIISAVGFLKNYL